MDSTYFALASKENFNRALRHFYKVTDVVDELDDERNLADVINEELDEKEVLPEQVLPIVGAVLRDKFNYSYHSYNVVSTVSNFEKIANETGKWTAIDFVIVYYNPSGKVILINPINLDHWERVRELTRDQLAVIYAKYSKDDKDSQKIEREAIEALEEMLAGKDVFRKKAFIDTTKAPAAPIKKKAEEKVSAGKKKITPKYGIQVTNELFHNGNVEAWKKIVESYLTKYPDLDVHIYFEGEIINDINALFKWGKVKSGDSIFFQVSGEDIRGVSKLQKYLFEGASQRFEQFLKIGVGQVLNLF